MVYVTGPSLEGCGFHSWKGQFFACQFLSIVAQIFAFLVIPDVVGCTCMFGDMSSPEDTQTTEGSQEVPLTNSLKHAAACRSMLQRAAAYHSEPTFSSGPLGISHPCSGNDSLTRVLHYWAVSNVQLAIMDAHKLQCHWTAVC